MEWIIAIIGLLVGFLGMEAFSWWIHKYLMHGMLWKIHRTHHIKTKGFFELNDVFTLLFGGSAVALIFWGMEGFHLPFWVGSGISVYGMLYFVLHDMFIHKRVKGFSKSKNAYLKAIFKAHQAHHKSKEKDDSESFGLLVVRKKFFS